MIGYFYLSLIFIKRSDYSKQNAIHNNNIYITVIKLFFIIGLIGFFIDLFFAFRYAITGPGSYFFNLRYANTVEGKILYGQHLFLFFHVATLLAIINNQSWNIKRNKLVLLVMIWCFSSIFTMARTSLFAAIISILASYFIRYRYFEKKSKIKSKPFILVSIFLIISFWIFGIATGKIQENFISTFMSYLGYPIIAFDKYILSYAGHGKGKNVFYPIIKIFNIFTNERIVPKAEIIFLERNAFNVFTVISDPYLDFGIIGVFFIPLFLGIFYKLLYIQVRKANLLISVYYSLLLFPLIISFFEYTFKYLSWIYYAFIIIILKIFSEIYYQKKKLREIKI
jgi:oligosaccharide repeat unit polymerase